MLVDWKEIMTIMPLMYGKTHHLDFESLKEHIVSIVSF